MESNLDQNRNKEKREELEEEEDEFDDFEGEGFDDFKEEHYLYDFFIKNLKIPPLNKTQFIKGQAIGYGLRSNIYAVTNKSNNQKYAAKTFIDDIEKVDPSILKELAILSRVENPLIAKYLEYDKINLSLLNEITILSQMNHPSIIKFIGYSFFKYNYSVAIVTELYRNGPLERIIKLEKKGKKFEFWNPTMKLVSIFHIASAISYLHSHNILHRNIRPRNILLDDYFLPKLSGFSSSIFLNDIKKESSEESIGSAPYMAPEIFMNNEYSKASDVYAFAICIYEILTGKLVYRKKSDTAIMYLVTIKKDRPKFKESFPKCYQQLIERCWSDDPKERPSFDEIVNELLTNKDFITSEIDEKLYRSYVDIYFKELEGIDTTSIKNQLISKDQQTYIYNKIQSIIEREAKLEEEEKKEILKTIKTNQINIDQFEIINKNYSGGIGYVYKIQEKETKQIYAAKILRNKEYEKEFLRELKIHSELNYLSIVKLIGYSPTDFEHENNLVIITEYANNGSLEEILDKERNDNQADIEILNNTYKLINIYGIAAAISYLHHQNFIHLDLKPGNVLLEDHLFPKICDFGLSIKVSSHHKIIQDIAGTLLFMAPEKFVEGISNKEVDIYAFGMLLHEVMTKEHPFDKLTPQNIMYKIHNKKEFKIDSTIPSIYKKLIKSCINRDPRKRPTIDEITDKLKNQQEFIEDNIDKELYKSFIEMIELENEGQDTTTKIKQFPIYHVYGDNSASSTSTESLSLTSTYDMIDDIEETKEIENGLISNIYEYRHKKTGNKYAVTISNFPIKYFDTEKIKQEAEELIKLNHPCIQRFYGFSSHNKKHQPKPIIINENISQRTLFEIIENERIGKHDPEWTHTTKLIIIYGIASGMSYLHSHNIYHPILNPKNIRIDSQYHPHLSEIGFYIRPENSKTIIRTTKKIKDDNILYLSPEKLKSSDNITEKSDVYSYSLVVYEIIANKSPFDKNIGLPEIITKIVDGNYRLEITETIPNFFKEMINRCLSYDPKDRPSFTEIVSQLENEPTIITTEINREKYLRYQTFLKQNSK